MQPCAVVRVSVCRRFVADRAPEAWRPRFHVTGERNWINDPNGPIRHDGVYHLFYQANPDAPSWGRPVWGHVTSTDLVTWTRRPLALSPEPGAADAEGCWSGCTRIVQGRPAIYYTGVVGEDEGRVESVCRAWGSADLLAWERDAANPLVPGPPPQLCSGYHRDPFLWQDDDGWHMLLGGGTSGDGRHGQVLRYDSPDATAWSYKGVFYSAPRWIGALDAGEHWECPQLLLEGDAAALVVSCQAPAENRPLLHSVAFTGALRDGRFDGELDGKLDHGDVFYAAALFRDESGRTLLWGWAQERLHPDGQATLPHAGALSLPRDVYLHDGRLRTHPISELQRLRRGALDQDARDGSVALLAQSELAATFAGRGHGGWKLIDRDGIGRVLIDVDLDRHCFRVAVTDGNATPHPLTAPLQRRGSHAVRVFIDGSLIEAVADDERFVTTRAYPEAGAWSRAQIVADPDVRTDLVGSWALRSDVIGLG
jgi:beta-fructofuranosidase